MKKSDIKGWLRHYAKFISNSILGLDILSDPLTRHKPKHIQVIFLILYYGIFQWLPNFDSRPFGRISNKLRVFCVRRLFEYVGEGVNIGRRARFGTGYNIRLGHRSNLGAECIVPSNIRIGDNVMMGPNNFFFGSFTHRTDDTTIPMIEQGLMNLPGQTVIEDDVWIGRECLVMPNVRIGSHSIIGARTVVTKDVPEGVLYAGNPGSVRKNRY